MIWLVVNQMSLYSPSSVEWNQYGHDYQKTRRAPLKCTSPANVNRIWTIDDSPPGDNGGDVWNIVYDGNLDGTNEVMGGGQDLGLFSSNLILRLHPYSNSSNIFEISGFANEGNYLGLYTAGKVSNERRVLFTYYYDDSDAWDDDFGDKVRVINGWTGATIWDVEFCHNTSCLRGHPTIIDIDNNQCPEVMFGNYNNIISKNLCDFSTVWQTNVSGLCAATVAVGSFSGQWGVVVLSCDNRIRILNPINGTIISTSGVYSYNNTSGPLVIDIDNDGSDEVIFSKYNSNYSHDDGWTCYYNYNVNIRAVKPISWTTVWTKTHSGTYSQPVYCDDYGCYCPEPGFGVSEFAAGRILPGNQLGIAYLMGYNPASLVVIRADNGQTVFSGNYYYYGSPSVADLSGDGIEGVIVSNDCGNPREHSYVNGWTSPVWSAAGCADEPPISSDLIIARAWMDYSLNPPQGQLIIVEGDISCYTNVWLCQSAEQTTPTETWESLNKPKIYYTNGYLNIENYKGDIEVFRLDGYKILKSSVNNNMKIRISSKGVYFVKTSDNTYKIVIN